MNPDRSLPRPASALPRLGAALLLVAAACAPMSTGAPVGTPGTPSPRLPPVPHRDGPLRLDVVYPTDSTQISVRDSTFVYGSTGTGRATVTVDGYPVTVAADGAFLGFLPVPQDSVYHVSATAHGQTQTEDVSVSLPPALPVLPPDSVAILTGSAYPAGAITARPDERIEVGFTGTAGGRASLLLPGDTAIPLVEQPAESAVAAGLREFGTNPARLQRQQETGWSRYRGVMIARPLVSPDTAVPWPALAAPRPPAAADTAAGDTAAPDTAASPGEATFQLVLDGDTVRQPLALNLALLPHDLPRVAVATLPAPRPESPGVVRASPVPGGTWSYFWPVGTRLNVTGERDGDTRVMLAPGLDAWLDPGQLQLLPVGTPPVRGRIGTVRLESHPGEVDVRFALSERVPFVVEPRDHGLDITIYGAGDTGWLQYGRPDPFVRSAHWTQVSNDVYRFSLELSSWPWGYEAGWDENGDLVVRVRKPPRIDRHDPLRGLTIAVDAGHPPGGTIGPYRLTEAQANLAVARHLQVLLERAGAHVLMTRSDTLPVALYQRTDTAEKAGADLLVSIHNNAFPDGVNPYVNNGTSTYYFHPQAEALARDLDHALVRELGLRNLGVGRSSLALVRNTTWMPAVLTETMFMMIPRQGAALANPKVQLRIARAHLRGIERFLLQRARLR